MTEPTYPPLEVGDVVRVTSGERTGDIGIIDHITIGERLAFVLNFITQDEYVAFARDELEVYARGPLHDRD